MYVFPSPTETSANFLSARPVHCLVDGMLTLVFTPREAADVPVQIGPVPGIRIQGNTMHDARSGAVIAHCHGHHWVFEGKVCYRADCAGPVTVNLDGCEAVPARFGPFQHFSLSDGMAYVDRAVFAQLNSSGNWYVEQTDTECPKLLLLPVRSASR